MKKVNTYLTFMLLGIGVGITDLSYAQVPQITSSVSVANQSGYGKNMRYQKAYNLALTAYKQRDYEKTIQEGLDVLPEDTTGDLHAMVGDSFFQLNAGGTSEKNKRGVLTARALMEATLKKNPKNRVANNTLGNIYTMGMGVPVDNKKAYDYFKINAEQGYALDAFNTGQVAHTIGNVEDALNWYEKSLELAKKDKDTSQHPFVDAAYRNMAVIFYSGNKKFSEKRIKYLPDYVKNPFRAGNQIVSVANDFYEGNGVPKNTKTFLTILHSVADKKATEDTDFNYRLAVRAALVEAYMKKDLKDDMKAFNYAFLTENQSLMNKVSGLQVTNNFKQAVALIGKDSNKSLALLKKEVKAGNKYAESLVSLSNLNKNSFELLSRDFYQGNYLGLTTLVISYISGEGSGKNIAEAKNILKIRKLDKSIPVSKEFEVQFKFLDAMIVYAEGKSKEAITMLKNVSEEGSVDAMYQLGLILMNEGDFTEGHKYLEKALSSGHVGAKEALKELQMLPGESSNKGWSVK